ncbi:MAG: helix-turn-helix domain-containing protein [Thermodesulfovibrionales bacterium]|nr:helix-turn-helix domain-containing protein [Thermodesulfovibrionales bacterium]
MSKIFSGIRDLDNLIDSLYVGDNVVWEIEAGTSPEVFALNFIHQSFSENKHVTYISFNKSPQTILQQIGEIPRQKSFTLLDCFTSGKGKNDKAFTKFYENAVHTNVRKIDDPKNIDQLTSLLASFEDSFPSGGRYVFDSLTGMQDLWGDEQRTYKFFTYLCPLLYDLGTVAYWLLEKDAHSQKFKANLRHITQVVLELYKRKDRLWIKALKLEGRPNREAFKPHSYEISGKTISISSVRKEPSFDHGTRIKELRTKIGMSQKELADKVDLTPSFISQMESNQITPSLNSFMQICTTLGVSVSDMLEKKPEDAPWLIRKAKVFAQPTFKNGGSSGFSIVKDTHLSGSLIVLEPHAKMKSDLMPPAGSRLLYVIKGDISVIVDTQQETLQPGDSLYLIKGAPAQIKNEGGDSAELLFVSFPRVNK